MHKTLIFFALSLAVISAFHTSPNPLSFRGVDAFTESREKSSKSPIHSLVAPKEGKIRVVKGTIDQMAAVDLKENTDTNSKMLIALYTSTSLLAFNQGNQFQSYDCTQYDCQLKTGTSPTISYPYFIASGSMASLSIWADYNNWVLSKTSPCFIATAFNLDKNNFEHKESFGYLALGYDNAEANFKNPNKNFLVYWKDDAFLVDFTYTEYSTSKVKMNVPADKNWIVSVESKFVFGTYIEPTNGLGYKMILDINTDVIGLPLAIYNRVIEEFGKNGMKCVSTTHGPYLTCNGNYSNSLIPNMTIWFSDINSLQLSLSELVPNPPTENTIADFRVNVKALDRTLSNENYVTPAFENYFIIGSNVLSKYTTLFNMSSQSIIAYEETGPSSEQVMRWLKWVIIGIIALIAACCLAVCFCCGLSAWCIGKLTGKKKETSGAYQHVSE